MGPKRAILSGQIRHGANPILRMGSGNAVVRKHPAQNETFTKDKARGANAAAMAVGRILSNEVGPSPHETQRPEGFLFV